MKKCNDNFSKDVRLVAERPSFIQFNHQQLEFYGFIHFSMNTFTNKEWGDGTDSPSLFNPTKLDVKQWVKIAADSEMKGLILTCKHHDGFCLWPSQYTEYSIKNSPYKQGNGNIVKEFADACHEAGIKFGVYLSPWDRNTKLYGTGEPYDTYFLKQLEELLIPYGDVFCVWLDGACGEGENGKVQIYNWAEYYKLIRKLQPGASINICGPDVRWCGNEAADTRDSEWSVVPTQLSDNCYVAEKSQKDDDEAFRTQRITEMERDLGSRECLANIEDIMWYPAEVDVSIRPGWFYHSEEDNQVKTIEELKDIYLRSVGGNTTLLLNIPPNKEGLIYHEDEKNLKKLGEFIRDSFSDNLVPEANLEALSFEEGYGILNVTEDSYESYYRTRDGVTNTEIVIDWPDTKEISYIVMKENILLSQRIEKYEVLVYSENGECIRYEGTTVGYKKIIPLTKMKTNKVTLRILDARVSVTLSFVGIY